MSKWVKPDYNAIYKIDVDGNKKYFCDVRRSPFSDYHNRMRKSVEYHGYIYRFMSKEEFMKYTHHSLEDNNTEWYDTTDVKLRHHRGHASYNKGYCFFGETYYASETLKDHMSLNDIMKQGNIMWAKRNIYIDWYTREQIFDINECNRVDMEETNFHRNYMDHALYFFDDIGITNRRMNILCKFRYDGIIEKSIGVYMRLGYDGDPDDFAYLEEYGLPNYNDLKLVQFIDCDPCNQIWTEEDEEIYKHHKEEDDE